MTAREFSSDEAISRKTLGPLLLLSLSIFINCVDRGNLSIAAPLLKEELHLSAYHLGILLGASFWTYTILMVVSGWTVDRFEVSWVLAGESRRARVMKARWTSGCPCGSCPRRMNDA